MTYSCFLLFSLWFLISLYFESVVTLGWKWRGIGILKMGDIGFIFSESPVLLQRATENFIALKCRLGQSVLLLYWLQAGTLDPSHCNRWFQQVDHFPCFLCLQLPFCSLNQPIWSPGTMVRRGVTAPEVMLSPPLVLNPTLFCKISGRSPSRNPVSPYCYHSSSQCAISQFAEFSLSWYCHMFSPLSLLRLWGLSPNCFPNPLCGVSAQEKIKVELVCVLNTSEENKHVSTALWTTDIWF